MGFSTQAPSPALMNALNRHALAAWYSLATSLESWYMLGFVILERSRLEGACEEFKHRHKCGSSQSRHQSSVRHSKSGVWSRAGFRGTSPAGRRLPPWAASRGRSVSPGAVCELSPHRVQAKRAFSDPRL